MIKKVNIFFAVTWAVFSLSTFSSPCTVDENNTVINTTALLSHLEVLSSNQFRGRKFATPGNKMAQDYIISRLENLSIPPFKGRYRHKFTKSFLFGTKQGANVIAFIEGKKHVDHFIVISAHYDHLGSKGNKIYNGADDNASGTAALLAYAEILINKPLDYSVILLFTDGEEVNLLGAKAFFLEQKQLLKKIKLNINIDMIAGNHRTKALNYISHDLNLILTKADQKNLADCQINQAIPIKKGFKNSKKSFHLSKRINWLKASDHAIFYQNDIPLIYFGVGTHKNYHSPKDTFQNINNEFFKSSVNAIYHQLLFIDKNIIFTVL